MNRLNLLPPSRIAADRRRRAARRWAWINATYGVVLAAVAAAYVLSATHSPVEAAAAVNVSQLNVTLAAMRSQAATLDTQLRSIREVTGRPDWGVLINVIARTLGDDAVLEGIEAMPAVPGALDASPNRFVLAGVARSQASLSELVLRLESLRLFTRVQLTQSMPDATRGANGVAFRLVSTLPEEKP